jgi:hypothetical protein
MNKLRKLTIACQGLHFGRNKLECCSVALFWKRSFVEFDDVCSANVIVDIIKKRGWQKGCKKLEH